MTKYYRKIADENYKITEHYNKMTNKNYKMTDKS
jgi:hypothetical protein